MVKLDVPANGLPVFLFGLKAVAVALDNLGRVDNVALVLEQRGNTLDVDLSGNDLGKDAGHLLHRLQNAESIRDKGR